MMATPSDASIGSVPLSGTSPPPTSVTSVISGVPEASAISKLSSTISLSGPAHPHPASAASARSAARLSVTMGLR